MTIAFDAESHALRSSLTGLSDPETHTHTPVGTPRGVFLFYWVANDSGVDRLVSATYGGVSMSHVTGSPLATSIEGQSQHVGCMFLGSGIPTGAQTVSIDLTGISGFGSFSYSVVTITAAADTQIEDTSTASTTGTNPSCGLTIAHESMAFAAMYHSANAPSEFSAASGHTLLVSFDEGSQSIASTYRTALVTSDTTVTVADASSGTYGMLAVAVRELLSGAGQAVSPAKPTITVTPASLTVSLAGAPDPVEIAVTPSDLQLDDGPGNIHLLQPTITVTPGSPGVTPFTPIDFAAGTMTVHPADLKVQFGATVEGESTGQGDYGGDAPVRATSTVMPELVVEWLPTTGPGSSDGDWCDITEYVTQGKTSRGRQYELDAFQAGSASLTLQSFTRLFDPNNTAGPFYPWLNPMRQIRISAVWNSVRYPIFRGYITDWGQTHQQDKLYVTTITAKDAFVVFEQYKLPSSAWALEIQRDDPTAWFRLGESDTVRMTDNSPNGNYGLYDNCQQGQQGLVVNDSDGAVSFAHSLEERAVIQNPNLISGYPFTFSCMLKVDNNDPGGAKYILTALTKTVGSQWLGAFIGLNFTGFSPGASPGCVYAYMLLTASDYYFVEGQTRVDDGLPHHVAIVFDSATSATIYVDGVEQFGPGAIIGTPAFPGNPPNGWVIGNTTDLISGDFGFGTNDPAYVDTDGNTVFPMHARGTIDEVCVWDGSSVLATRIAAHSFAALTGWEGDDTGTRVDRFLDRIDWPANLRDIDTGISILGAADWSAGSSALSVMQAWADTEVGQFLIGTNGEVIWRSRHFPLLDATATTSQATFSDAHGAGLMYDDIDPPRDSTLIRNPVTASRRNGVSVTVKDQALIEDKYGPRTWAAPNSEDRDDASVRDRAMWLLARYKEETTRIASVQFTPTQDPDNLYPAALGLEIGNRVTVERTPLGMGSQTSVDQILEGVDHTFTPFTWQTTFRGSPVDPNIGSYLILDDPTYGILDQQLLAY